MNRLIILATLAAIAMAPAVATADDLLDRESLRSEWRERSPLRAYGEDDRDEAFDHDDDALAAARDRLRLYDERGQPAGRVERNPLIEDRLDLYDNRGARTGSVRQHSLFEDRLDVYDERGRRVREIRKHPLLDDQYDIYDDRGRRVGSVRRNPLLDGRYDVYDERGRRTGRVEAE
jgi:uncharacterized protein YxjI